MDTLQELESFLGWCTVINIGVLSVSAVAIVLMRGMATRIHGMMFGLDEVDLCRGYFQFLAQYEMAIFIFNLVPYLALKIAG